MIIHHKDLLGTEEISWKMPLPCPAIFLRQAVSQCPITHRCRCLILEEWAPGGQALPLADRLERTFRRCIRSEINWSYRHFLPKTRGFDTFDPQNWKNIFLRQRAYLHSSCSYPQIPHIKQTV